MKYWAYEECEKGRLKNINAESVRIVEPLKKIN